MLLLEEINPESVNTNTHSLSDQMEVQAPSNTEEQTELLTRPDNNVCKKTFVHTTDEKTIGVTCKCP